MRPGLFLRVAIAVAALATAAAHAAVWNFSVCNGSTVVPGTAAGTQTGAGAVGNVYGCAADASVSRDLMVSAWGAASAANDVFGTAFVSSWGVDGFGVGSSAEGGAGVAGTSAAIDNDPVTQAPNLLLLSFGSAFVLKRVTLGWTMNDADFTIMAYTGALAPSAFIDGMTAGTLTAGGAPAGWSLVQHVGDASPDVAQSPSGTNVSVDVNPGAVASAYWLVSAHDADFGGNALDTLVDYVALLAVEATAAPATGDVPAPGVLALVGLGLAALAVARTRAAAPAISRPAAPPTARPPTPGTPSPRGTRRRRRA